MIIYDGIIYALQEGGGISRYYSELIPSVQKLSGEVSILAPKNKRGVIPVQVASLSQSYEARVLERLRSAPVRPLLKQQNRSIFHSTYYRLPSDSKIQSVVTVHDMIHEFIRHDFSGRVFRMQKRTALEQAAHIICVSENTRRDLLSVYPHLERKPISVIHHGVSVAFGREPETARSPDLLFVGSRSGYKDFDFAVAIAAAMPDRHLHIVGGGPLSGGEVESLNRLCSDRFTAHGTVSDQFLNTLYNRCKVLLYPSYYEGFGIPPLEAMRAGCIPVYRAVTSLPEVVGPAGINIGNDTPAQVASAIASLDGGRLASLQALGRQRAMQFSWERCAKLTVEVYSSLLNTANTD